MISKICVAIAVFMLSNLVWASAHRWKDLMPLPMAFLEAVRKNDLSSAETLLSNNHVDACVPRQQRDGRQAIHLADSIEMIDLLLRFGANINAQDLDGMSALHLHVWYFNEEVVQHLLDKGANSQIRNHNGHRPINFATEEMNTEILKKLR